MPDQTREYKNSNGTKSNRPATKSIVGAIFFGVVAVALGIYAAVGGAEGVPFWYVLIAVVIIVLLGIAILLRDRRGQRSLTFWKRIRPVVVIAAAPLGFYLLERASNNSLFKMDVYYVILNICLLAILYVIVYFIGQRSRISILVYLAICLFIGAVDHFLIQINGQPVTPADMAAWQTALMVSSGYSYTLTEHLIECIVIFMFYCAVLIHIPRITITRRRVIVSTSIALACALAFGICFTNINISETFSVKINAWLTGWSYSKQGSTICFFKQLQDLQPAKPDGYSSDAADELLKEADETKIGDTNRLTSSDEDPTVIVVMNETFSDLSMYPGLEDTDAYPDLYYEIADSAIESGNLFMSARGAGTCNSEFEFLTGASMGNIGSGVYPYMFYNLTGTTCMPTYFNALGYTTHAIHPAEGTNWRRDSIYQQFEFDDFADIEAFENAPTLRDLVTDKASYDYVLDLLEADENPQFIFDVTIQNHSGYQRGGISKDKMVTVDIDGSDKNDELNEYLSCIQQSDNDIDYFVKKLDSLDRPIVLCFFGDHQPGFISWLFEATHNGKKADSIGLDAVQQTYTVPYMIWANKAAQDEGITKKNVEATRNADARDTQLATRSDIAKDDTRFTSINYLSARLVEDCGLPLSSYQKFLLNTSEIIPSMNINGYMTNDGTWHRFEDISDAKKALNDYEIVQYDNLFNKKADW